MYQEREDLLNKETNKLAQKIVDFGNQLTLRAENEKEFSPHEAKLIILYALEGACAATLASFMENDNQVVEKFFNGIKSHIPDYLKALNIKLGY